MAHTDIHVADSAPRRGGWEATVRQGMLAGLGVTVLCVVLTLLRYPVNAHTAATDAGASGVAVVAIAGLTAWVYTWGPHLQQRAAVRVGSIVGLASALLWIAEISFNNFVDPAISTAVALGIVDNAFWALIALVVLVGAIGCAFTAGRIGAGVLAGLWGGVISGLGACLMALLLIHLWMSFILRDPLNRQEWATLGPTSGEPTMASYFAYQPLTGAVLHLLVLGLGMGLLLGILGGLLGTVLRALHQAIARGRSV